jgi:hypothetical protein
MVELKLNQEIFILIKQKKFKDNLWNIHNIFLILFKEKNKDKENKDKYLNLNYLKLHGNSLKVQIQHLQELKQFMVKMIKLKN